MCKIILYYTQVGPGDRPAPPGGRLAPRCRGVWGAATPPSGGSSGQSPPGSLNYAANRKLATMRRYFRENMVGMLFDCYWLKSVSAGPCSGGIGPAEVRFIPVFCIYSCFLCPAWCCLVFFVFFCFSNESSILHL